MSVWEYECMGVCVYGSMSVWEYECIGVLCVGVCVGV